jgi:hypothetical protein
MIFLTENIPYTPKMLADELDFEEGTVALALQALEKFNMIVSDNGYFTIAGWEEYQNIEGMDKIREQNRLRKQKQRARQKLTENVSRFVTGQVTQGHETDIEEDKDSDTEEEDKKDKIVKIDTSADAPFIPSILTRELIDCGYISSDDICIDMYNNAIQEIIDSYSFEMARSCVWYFCKRYKENPTDENGNVIENKVAYFTTAINNSADRLDRENNRLTSGVGSWLYS